MKRHRVLYSLIILLVIVCGLLSRLYPHLLPQVLGKYPGDALWAMMIYFNFGFLFPTKPTALIALITLIFSSAVEFSQIYHAPWIDPIRATTGGHFVLGSVFSWIDLVAYGAGILLACFFEIGLFDFIKSNRP